MNVPLFYANEKLAVITPCSGSINTGSLFQNFLGTYEEVIGVPGVFETTFMQRIMPGAGSTYRKNALLEINGM
jgi:hypothetical protein